MCSTWDDISFENLKQSLRTFANHRDWNQYHTPRNLALALIGEVGELAECFQWRTFNECSEQLKGFSPEEKVHVGEELSDVLLYLCRLADRCGFHLPRAVSAKIQLNAKKYPVQLAKGSPAKYHAYSAETGIAWNNQKDAQQAQTCDPEESWGSTTLEALRSVLEEFVLEREWQELHTARNLALALAGEAGELCELFQFRPEEACSPGLPEWSDSDKVELSQEISDVLIYLVRLADVCGIDLACAVQCKLKKNAQKYPVKKARGKWEKYTSYVSNVQDDRYSAANENPFYNCLFNKRGLSFKISVCVMVGSLLAFKLLYISPKK
mmetsp:Transcript_10847/g.14101  ORF Transcript_10847/g.14101 Transcript_10847/m.14101 type:complete len:324 (+) Transcript_10847:41-1012(+)